MQRNEVPKNAPFLLLSHKSWNCFVYRFWWNYYPLYTVEKVRGPRWQNCNRGGALLRFKIKHLFYTLLKAVDTIGNCQRPVFTLGVSQLMPKIKNLWKLELNRSSKLRDNNERKKHPCHTKLCAFWCLISRPQILNLRSRNQICGKLLLSQKLRHFRGSCFSQCVILSTSPHYS